MTVSIGPLVFFCVFCLSPTDEALGASDKAVREEGTIRLTDLKEQIENGQSFVPVNDRRCGVSCLYLLFNILGKKEEFKKIEQVVSVGPTGSSLLDIETGARSLGLSLQSARFRLSSLANLPLPAIIHLEPAGPGSLNHYVILLRVGNDGLTIVDPTYNNLITLQIEKFSRMATGYCLVITPPFFTANTICAFLLAALIAFIFWRYTRHFFTNPILVQTFRRHGASAMALSFLLLAIGCNSKTQKTTDIKVSPRTQIEFSEYRLDLGLLVGEADANGIFKFKNLSQDPLELSIGKTSCSCLEVSLKPNGPISPGSSGEVSLNLTKSEDKPAGMIEGKVLISINNSTETHSLTVTALNEGFNTTDLTYVIRKKHLDGLPPPPLNLEVLTVDKKAAIAIDAVEFRALPRFKPVAAGAKIDSSYKIPGKIIEGIFGDISNLSYSEPGLNGDLFRREVSIPITLSKKIDVQPGEIHILYRIKNEKKKLVAKFICINE